MPTLTEDDFALLFLEARTLRTWQPLPLEDAQLERIYELACLPPTSGNCEPARIVFVKSQAAKERLRPALDAGNVDKTMTAPATAIIAWDTEYHLKLQKLNPHAKNVVEKAAARSEDSRMREGTQSATLQAAYVIFAARAIGLDCGPIGGFDASKVDAAFFPDGKWKSLLLINLGYGDRSKLFPRSPRLNFEEACRID